MAGMVLLRKYVWSIVGFVVAILLGIALTQSLRPEYRPKVTIYFGLAGLAVGLLADVLRGELKK